MIRPNPTISPLDPPRPCVRYYSSSVCVHNLKCHTLSLSPFPMRKRKTQNLELAWFGMVGSLTHSWSSAMSPFDRAPMTSDSPFLKTRRLSCSPSESYRSLFITCYLLKVANFSSAHTRIYNCPRWVWPNFNFVKSFDCRLVMSVTCCSEERRGAHFTKM